MMLPATADGGGRCSASAPAQPCSPTPQSPPTPCSTNNIEDPSKLLAPYQLRVDDPLDSYNFQDESRDFLSQFSIIEASSWPAIENSWSTEINTRTNDIHTVLEHETSTPPNQDYDRYNSGLDDICSGGELNLLDYNPEWIEPNIFNLESHLEERTLVPSSLCSDEVQLFDYVSLEELIVTSSSHGDSTAKNSTDRDRSHSVDNVCQDLFQDSQEATLKPASKVFDNRDDVGSICLHRRTQRGRNPRPSTIIKDWYFAHSSSPYPTAEEIAALVTLSGLSKQQVQQCLSNLRARTKLAYTHQAFSDTFEQDHNVCIIGQSSNIMPVHKHDQLPEASSFVLSLTALKAPHDESSRKDDISWNDLSPPHFDNLQSQPCQRIQPSLNIGYKRKGKRQHTSRFNEIPADLATSSPSKSSDGDFTVHGKYECTVCCKSFKNSYGWKRHESGVHGYTDTEWVCMLNQTAMLGSKCFFCSENVASMTHFDIHDIQTCLDKDICERTFTRKDLLKQHIQQMHCVSKVFQVPKAWSQKLDSSRVDQQALWCGFCLSTRGSITERMDHVAKHFRDGYNIESWKAPASCSAA